MTNYNPTAASPEAADHRYPPNPQLTERDIRKKHLWVAPYCRVSTDSEEQLNSYNSQIAYYTEKIAAMPEWTMVHLYADKGITGTSMKRRKEFLKMLRVCNWGRIDFIITKNDYACGVNETVKYLCERSVYMRIFEEWKAKGNHD